MFGESDSESPRVPSPWDTIVSTPPSPSPGPFVAAIPKLVPEQDDGNVEYKLQLLSPSPARFARLVTQMKWRLLEGGGQAYYELGVADSGMLVGLPRAELEQSLETLDAMAGEIGASVIVVKEIEVPAAMAGLVATQTDSWNGKRARRRQALTMRSEGSTDDSTTSTSTTTETEMSTTDVDDEDDMSSTILLEPPSPKYRVTSPSNIFSMDDFDSAAENGDAESSDTESPPAPQQFSIDLEIASVFKPRPVRTMASAHVPLPAKSKRGPKTKKGKHLPFSLSPSTSPVEQAAMPVKPTKAQNRRQARDRRREERRQALMMYASAALEAPDLVSGLEALHVSVDVALVSEPTIPTLELNAASEDDDGEDDVFPSPLTATPAPFTDTAPVEREDAPRRLIVEALVVRKMSLEEAFLDFGGFSPHD
ncbi:GTP-binding protein 2 [Mycena sanguinolenta]|uniref:GTP-binding protein 2 n=1 Tax=Mycena sanguinolenta TaxID=230812 RepID=A0A8H6ZA77_9AGAR|nr:GTP-binding protein 2 [Mycena sanguinolenta]